MAKAGNASCRMGRLRTFHHHLRNADCALRRSPRPPATPCGPDRLLRARPSASARVSREYALRPADEDDAARHRSVLGPMGRILPRSPLVTDFAAGAFAHIAFRELAARFAVDHSLRRFCDTDGVDRAQNRAIAKFGRAALLGSRGARL